MPNSLYYIQRYCNRSNGVWFPYITFLILAKALVLYSCSILSNNSMYSFILSQVCFIMGYTAFILFYFSCQVSPKCLYTNSVCYTSILNACRTQIKNFLHSFFYLFYLCLPLPINFISGYNFGSQNYNTVPLIGKLTSFRFSRARVNTAKDFISIFLSSSSGYQYSSSSCFICTNICHFLISFSCNYMAINSLFRL